jgi:lipopolysaccharide/colanic/teichoic acid biosynthesis glycosyltransferase
MAEQVYVGDRQRVFVSRAGSRTQDLYFFCKRCLDVVLAALMLIFVFPAMLLMAILIKLDTPGPALFIQQRVGSRRRSRNGDTFWEICHFPCYKFRSMVQNADQSTHQDFVEAHIRGAVDASGSASCPFKLTDDPRVTRVGHILRKTSLDELPQLVNVLRGEMSLVGPRPDVPYSVELYSPWHRERFAALPGLTGLWQAKGRSNVTFDEMVRMDIEYVRNQSLWLDLKILLLTIPAVLSGRGAA